MSAIARWVLSCVAASTAQTERARPGVSKEVPCVRGNRSHSVSDPRPVQDVCPRCQLKRLCAYDAVRQMTGLVTAQPSSMPRCQARRPAVRKAMRDCPDRTSSPRLSGEEVLCVQINRSHRLPRDVGRCWICKAVSPMASLTFALCGMSPVPVQAGAKWGRCLETLWALQVMRRVPLC